MKILFLLLALGRAFATASVLQKKDSSQASTSNIASAAMRATFHEGGGGSFMPPIHPKTTTVDATPTYSRPQAHGIPTGTLARRDAFQCYSGTTANPNDCKDVFAQVRALDPNKELFVPPSQCKSWTHNSCLGGVCAKGNLTLIITAAKLSDILENTLFQNCMEKGRDGAFLNCDDPDGECEHYRVYLIEDPNALHGNGTA